MIKKKVLKQLRKRIVATQSLIDSVSNPPLSYEGRKAILDDAWLELDSIQWIILNEINKKKKKKTI